MSNKRVSELAPITSPELDIQDLLLLADISAHESKRLALGDLESFILSDGNLSGSLFGTASYAIQSLSASYAPNISASYARTSSWAFNVVTASYALAALSSSYVLSSSYAITASYALTCSVELVYSSAFADYARTASYLLYVPGFMNGSASYALSALSSSYSVSSSCASTASYLLYDPTFPNGTASYSMMAESSLYALVATNADYSQVAQYSNNSNNSNTALYASNAGFLQFDGITPNGTASYALVAKSVGGRINYGIFGAITQSTTGAQLDVVTILSSTGGQQSSSFDVMGTVVVPFTSSMSSSINLIAINRVTGVSASLDQTPISINIGGSTNISGTFKYPFSLQGETPMNGTYIVYVTASANNISIDPSRTVKFNVISMGDIVSVLPGERTIFSTSPDSSILYYSSSLKAGVFKGSASQVIASGSQYVTALYIPPASVSSVPYLWTLNNLTRLIADGNYMFLGGVPASLLTMSVSNCGLTTLPPLTTTAVSYLNCANNNLVGSVSFPSNMTYIDCSNNVNLSLPDSLPNSLTVFIGNGLYITGTPTYLPDTIRSMSLAQCPLLSTWNSPTLPISLSYFDCNTSPLTQIIGTIPISCSYMDVSNCQLESAVISNIGTGLVTNHQLNGTLNITNNPDSGSAPGIVANIGTLISRRWTVLS